MQIISLDAETSPFFSPLTFANYSHILAHFSADDYFAVGALTDDNLPIGLILVGQSKTDHEPHEILSIDVDDAYHNQGVATAMLRYLQGQVQTSIIAALKADYPDTLPHVVALKRVLTHCAFQQAPVELLTVRGPIHFGVELVPNVQTLPTDVSFRDWVTITDADKAEILSYVRQHAITGAHHPLLDIGIPIHEATSILLCHQERIIGWMINHQISEDTIRYSRLFIAPDWRKQGLGVRCFFESITRHHAIAPNSFAIFAAESNNPPMLAVIDYFRHHEQVEFTRFRRVLWHG